MTIKQLAWKTLRKNGIIPEKLVYRKIRGKITASGRLEIERLQQDLGMRNWNLLLQQMEINYPKDHLIRIMGFGNELSRYAITPFCDSNEFTEKVISLGARTNLIVSLFDQHIDLGNSSHSLLSEDKLQKMIKDKSHNFNRWQFPNFRTKWILPLLVESYLNDLKNISPDKHHKILKTVLSLILIMYRAEINTLSKNLHTGKTLNRKAALPFVVMGLPAWFNQVAFNSADYLFHFRWLYKLGVFFGTIDDIIDLEEDINKNQPNQFSKLIEQNQLSELNQTRIIQKLISDARWIADHWEKKAEQHTRPSEGEPEVFGTCIVSWFGGEKNYMD